MKKSMKSSVAKSAATGRNTSSSANTTRKSPQKSGPIAPAKKQAVHSNANPGLDVTSAHSEKEPEEWQLVLLGKYLVEEGFLDAVEDQFLEIYPYLLEDVEFTPAELVGEPFWTSLTEEGQRLAILCLKHLATENEVPLVDVTCECCGISSFEIV